MAEKPNVPSPRPMPTTGWPDRNDPPRNDLYPRDEGGRPHNAGRLQHQSRAQHERSEAKVRILYRTEDIETLPRERLVEIIRELGENLNSTSRFALRSIAEVQATHKPTMRDAIWC